MLLEETEKELVEACQRGDSEARRVLFDRHKDAIYSIALRFSGDPSVAQDIAQDAFLKVFSAIGSFRGDSGFESWLYRLVVNTCFDHRRRTRRWMPLVEDFLHGLRAPDASVLDEMVRTEFNGRVQSVVNTLPDEQRMIIVLRYTKGLSYEEIGEILGLPKGTVASRLNRAHRILERRLGRLVGGKKPNA